jgi:hypothetical protein
LSHVVSSSIAFTIAAAAELRPNGFHGERRAMLTGGWDAVPAYYLFAALAFAEVAVLFASAIGLAVVVVREIIREIDHLLDVASRGRWLGTQRPPAARYHRAYEAVGGHNERF